MYHLIHFQIELASTSILFLYQIVYSQNRYEVPYFHGVLCIIEIPLMDDFQTMLVIPVVWES